MKIFKTLLAILMAFTCYTSVPLEVSAVDTLPAIEARFVEREGVVIDGSNANSEQWKSYLSHLQEVSFTKAEGSTLVWTVDSSNFDYHEEEVNPVNFTIPLRYLLESGMSESGRYNMTLYSSAYENFEAQIDISFLKMSFPGFFVATEFTDYEGLDIEVLTNEYYEYKEEYLNSLTSASFRKTEGASLIWEIDADEFTQTELNYDIRITTKSLSDAGMTEPGYYNVTLHSSMYEDQSFSVNITSMSRKVPSDLSVYVESSTGDIILETQDEDWLNYLYTYDSDEVNDQYISFISENRSVVAGSFSNDKYSEDFEYEPGLLRITSETQKKEGLGNGYHRYEIMDSKGKYVPHYSTSDLYISGALTENPKLVVTTDSITGDIIVECSDAEWIKEVYDAAENTYGVRTSHSLIQFIWWTSDYSQQRYATFSNDVNEEILLENGKLRIPVSMQIEKGMENGDAKLTGYAASYASTKDYNVLVEKAGKAIPTDATLYVDQTSGDIVVESDDQNWLNAIMNSQSKGLKLTADNASFKTDIAVSELVRESNGVRVKAETLIEHKLPIWSYDYKLYAEGYTCFVDYNGNDIYTVKGVDAVSNVRIRNHHDGGIYLLCRDNDEWIFAVADDENHNAITFITDNNTITFAGSELEVADDEMYGEHIIHITKSQLYEAGMGSNNYDVIVEAPGFADFEVNDIYLEGGSTSAPSYLEYGINDQELWMYPWDDEWSEALASDRGRIEIYDLGGYYVGALKNEASYEPIYAEDGCIYILLEEFVKLGMNDGGYYFNFYVDGYEYLEYYEIYLENLSLLPPSDLSVSVNNSGDLVIKTKDTAYLKKLVDRTNGESSRIIIDYDEYSSHIFFNADDYYMEDMLVYKNGTVILANQHLKDANLTNKTYPIYVATEGYSVSNPFNVTLKNMREMYPEDLEVSFVPSQGLKISTDNQNYLNGIFCVDLFIEETGDWVGSLYPEYSEEWSVTEGSAYISVAALIDMDLPLNTSLLVHVYHEEHITKGGMCITLPDLGLNYPEDLNVYFDDIYRIVIETEDEAYLSELNKVGLYFVAEDGEYEEDFYPTFIEGEGYIVCHAPLLTFLKDAEIEIYSTQVWMKARGYKIFKEDLNLLEFEPIVRVIEEGIIYPGDQVTLESNMAPNEDIPWKSNNTGVATVGEDGVITFKKAGKVTISADLGEFGKLSLPLVCEPINLTIKGPSKMVVGNIAMLSITNSTDRDISWSISDETILSLDEETGTITALAPGQAVLEGKVGSVKQTLNITVYPIDPSYKISSVIEGYLSSGMEPSETMKIETKANGESINELMEYTSSNPNAVIVDEEGNITAIAKGSAKITASLKDDPAKRKVTLDVKVIDAQARAVEVFVESELIEREENELTMEYESMEKGTMIPIGHQAYDRLGNPMESKVKWTSSDTKVASIKSTKEGTYLVINGAGQITISAQVQDARKETEELTLRIKEYMPKLEEKTIKLNGYESAAKEVKLYPAYGTEITEISLHDYDAKAKGYLEETSENFDLELEGNKGILTLNDPQLKKGNYKVLLKAEVDGTRVYEYELTIALSYTLPSVGVKVTGYVDTFNAYNSTIGLTLDHKGNTLEYIEFEGTEAFERNFEVDLEGNIVVNGLETESNGKLNNKGTLKLYYAQYNVPVEKSITLSTKAVKPSYKVEPGTITFNPEKGNAITAIALIDSKTKEVIDLDEGHTVVMVTEGLAEGMDIDAQNDVIVIEGMSKAGTLKFEVGHEEWSQRLAYSVKLTSYTKTPEIQLSSKTITLNSKFNTQGTSALSVKPFNAITDIQDVTVEAASPNAETAKLDVYVGAYGIVADVIDGSIKNGSYKYNVKGTLSDGTELKAVVLTIKVENTEPQYKISSTSLKLNAYTAQPEIIKLTETLSKNTYNVEVSDMEVRLQANAKAPEQQVTDIVFERTEEGIEVYATDEAKVGTYTYYIRPEYDGVPSDKEVKVSVQVYDKAPSAKVNLKGNLNPIDAQAKVEGTVKLSNLVDEVESAEIEHGSLETEVIGGKVYISLKEGEVLSNQTIKTKLRLTMKNTQEEIETEISVKVARAVPTLKLEPSTLNIYDTTGLNKLVGSIKLNMSKVEAEVESIESLNTAALDKAYRVELRKEAEAVYLDVYLLDGAKIKAGSTTSLKYKINYVGESDLKKAPSITIKIADKSETVKGNLISNR